MRPRRIATQRSAGRPSFSRSSKRMAAGLRRSSAKTGPVDQNARVLVLPRIASARRSRHGGAYDDLTGFAEIGGGRLCGGCWLLRLRLLVDPTERCVKARTRHVVPRRNSGASPAFRAGTWSRGGSGDGQGSLREAPGPAQRNSFGNEGHGHSIAEEPNRRSRRAPGGRRT